MCEAARRRPPRWLLWGRYVVVSAAFGLVAAGVVAGVRSWRGYRDFERWQTDEPFVAAVDLGAVGETVVPFRQTCTAACDAGVWIKSSDGEGISLEGLAGRITLTDAAGRVVDERPFTGDPLWTHSDVHTLTNVDPTLPAGEYVARIIVDTPAAGAGVRTLHADYLLCGLEQLPAFLFGVAGAVLGTLGLLLGACTVPRFPFRGGEAAGDRPGAAARRAG